MRTALAILSSLAVGAAVRAQDPGAHAAPGDARPASKQAVAANTGPIGRLIREARPGATIDVPPGVYREHIRIDKPLALRGHGRATIDGGGGGVAGDIVEITAPDTVFSGFTVRATGIDLDTENAGIRVLAPRARVEDNTLEDVLFGIDLREAPGSTIRNNRIGGKRLDIARRGDGLRLWRCDNAVVEGNTIHDGRDAVLWYSRGITVRGNTTLRCRYGLHLMYSDEVVLENNSLEQNSVGIYLMYSKGVTVRQNQLVCNRGPSGYGLGLKETDRFTVEQNLVVGNRVGVYLDGSPFGTSKPGEFVRNIIAYNDVGITFLPAVRGNQLTENNFIDNFEQISVAGRGELKGNVFWKGERGNFWTDYTGYDQDHDGVGDFVHESQTLFENLMDREPKLRILLFSPAQQAIEFVGRALPAVRPEAKFTDEVPLMRPVLVDTGAPAPAADRAGLGLAAGGMCVVGALVVWSGVPSPRRRRPRSAAGLSVIGGVA